MLCLGCNLIREQRHELSNHEVREMIQEVYVESTWHDAAALQRQRDERYRALEASGYACERQDLYRVDGLRVFLVSATLAEQSAAATETTGTNSLAVSRLHSARAAGAGQATPAPRRRSPQVQRKVQTYEER